MPHSLRLLRFIGAASAFAGPSQNLQIVVSGGDKSDGTPPELTYAKAPELRSEREMRDPPAASWAPCSVVFVPALKLARGEFI